jgi:hypothetical protein
MQNPAARRRGFVFCAPASCDQLPNHQCPVGTGFSARRIDMIIETAKKLSELNSSAELVPVADENVQASRTSVT